MRPSKYNITTENNETSELVVFNSMYGGMATISPELSGSLFSSHLQSESGWLVPTIDRIESHSKALLSVTLP